MKAKDSSNTDVGQKHKKKVSSKPVDNFQTLAPTQAESLAMQFEYAQNSSQTMAMSEEARKKLRVDRLKR